MYFAMRSLLMDIESKIKIQLKIIVITNSRVITTKITNQQE